MNDVFLGSRDARDARVRARRRVVLRVGFVLLVVLTAVSALTACIFEESTYKGGGRIDQGGEAKTAEPTATAPEPTTQPTGTATADDSGGFPLEQ